ARKCGDVDVRRAIHVALVAGRRVGVCHARTTLVEVLGLDGPGDGPGRAAVWGGSGAGACRREAPDRAGLVEIEDAFILRPLTGRHGLSDDFPVVRRAWLESDLGRDLPRLVDR